MSAIRRALLAKRKALEGALQGPGDVVATQKQPRLGVSILGRSRTPPPLPTTTTTTHRGSSSTTTPSQDCGKSMANRPTNLSEQVALEQSKRKKTKPFRKNRRHLNVEATMSERPILPKLNPPTRGRYTVEGGVNVYGDDFRYYPGVNDNDSIEESGVASRLGWCSILPRDEIALFRNFPEGEDLADKEAMKLAQRVIVLNAQHRLYRFSIEKDLAVLRQQNTDLLKENKQLSLLPGQLDELKKERDSLSSKLTHLQGELTAEKAKVNSLEGYKEDFSAASTELGNIRSQYNALLVNHQEAEKELQKARKQAQTSLTLEERDHIRAEAVKEYRLSKDCHARKEAYSVGFVRYGFYLARSWLEMEKRVGETFPDLQYSDEVELFEAPDWTKYEPDSEDADTLLEKGAHDDLSNLTGPWSPFNPDRQAKEIRALDGLCNDDLPSLETSFPSPAT